MVTLFSMIECKIKGPDHSRRRLGGGKWRQTLEVN